VSGDAVAGRPRPEACGRRSDCVCSRSGPDEAHLRLHRSRIGQVIDSTRIPGIAMRVVHSHLILWASTLSNTPAGYTKTHLTVVIGSLAPRIAIPLAPGWRKNVLLFDSSMPMLYFAGSPPCLQRAANWRNSEPRSPSSRGLVAIARSMWWSNRTRSAAVASAPGDAVHPRGRCLARSTA
jgi:hypothetical protein